MLLFTADPAWAHWFSKPFISWLPSLAGASGEWKELDAIPFE